MTNSCKLTRTLFAAVPSILLIVALTSAAQAFEARPIELPEFGQLPMPSIQVLSASSSDPVDDEALPPRWIDRLTGALEGIPLRPVKIGREPRRPDDPEVGIGLVLRIPF